MRTKLLCTTMGVLVTGTALAGGTAMAADLGMRAPPPPAPMAYNWGGLYVGAFAGVTSTDPAIKGGYCYYSSYCYNEYYGSGTASIGGLAGADVGYNWQAGSLVYGLEGDFAAVFAPKSLNVDGTTSSYNYGYSAQTEAIWTIRGRAGLALDRTLLYVTAGFADIENKTAAIDGSSGYSATSWVPALAVGGGIEYALDTHWTVKAEGLYLAAANDTQAIHEPGNSSYYARVITAPSQAILKLGANFKF